MTVKELIEYLEKCKPEYELVYDCDYPVTSVIQVEDMVSESSRVELS